MLGRAAQISAVVFPQSKNIFLQRSKSLSHCSECHEQQQQFSALSFRNAMDWNKAVAVADLEPGDHIYVYLNQLTRAQPIADQEVTAQASHHGKYDFAHVV